MPDLASARKRVTATQTSMISVHRISTAPGARIFGVIWLPLLSCGGDARGGAPICNCQIQSRRAALISVRIAAPSPSPRGAKPRSRGGIAPLFTGDRKSVGQGKTVSVSVVLGGRRVIKKKKHK